MLLQIYKFTDQKFTLNLLDSLIKSMKMFQKVLSQTFWTLHPDTPTLFHHVNFEKFIDDPFMEDFQDFYLNSFPLISLY